MFMFPVGRVVVLTSVVVFCFRDIGYCVAVMMRKLRFSGSGDSEDVVLFYVLKILRM